MKQLTDTVPERTGISYMVAPVQRTWMLPDGYVHTETMTHLVFYAPHLTDEPIGAVAVVFRHIVTERSIPWTFGHHLDWARDDSVADLSRHLRSPARHDGRSLRSRASKPYRAAVTGSMSSAGVKLARIRPCSVCAIPNKWCPISCARARPSERASKRSMSACGRLSYATPCS